jgi:hypothetical protein
VWAFDWASLGLVGTFAVGAAFGVVMTLRLAKVLAQFFTDQIRRHPDD